MSEQSWDRKQGPVHLYFGLSYSSNLVLPRVLMQSMPLEWQHRMVDCLRDLDTAFHGVERPAEYEVKPVQWTAPDDLTAEELRQAGVEVVDDNPDDLDDVGCTYFYDGNEIESWHRVVPIPAADPLPHYRYGMVEPGPYGDEAAAS